jgi:hypothetical protein
MRQVVACRDIRAQPSNSATVRGMHVRVLAQVERRQVETEDRHGMAQAAQARLAEQGAAVADQRTVQHVEVGAEARRCRRSWPRDRMARRLQAVELPVRLRPGARRSRRWRGGRVRRGGAGCWSGECSARRISSTIRHRDQRGRESTARRLAQVQLFQQVG